MGIYKNVTNQYVFFLMVDATDFATPETGVTVTAKWWKDGSGLSTCSNTVSACTSGLYRLKLKQAETNQELLKLQFTGTGCADQWLILDTDQAKLSDIYSAITDVLTDTGTTLDDKVDSILAKSTSILTDTGTTLDDKIDSILVDTGTTLNNRTISIVDQTSAIKAKTDKLTYTSGNDLDANVQKVNDVALTGDGSATPWGPA